MFGQFPMLSAATSQLVVIDVQERLLPVILNHQTLVGSIQFLMSAAEILEVPVILTEQYPKGLGATVEPLKSHRSVIRSVEKLRFSAAEALAESGTLLSQIVLAGIESHICVQQTALELLDRGFQVFVVADCIGSRHADDYCRAIDRMARAGVTITTAEAIAFEWCQQAGTDKFRLLSRLVRDRDDARTEK